LVSIDFLTVPTARLGILFVLVVLAHGRRRVVHFNVTEHPTAQWTARQIVEAFPDESAPAYLLRDPRSRLRSAISAPRKGHGHRGGSHCAGKPVAEPVRERLIGGIRRECLNHVLVLASDTTTAS
jgi:putative transposase